MPANIVTIPSCRFLTNAEKLASFGEAMVECGTQVTVPAEPYFVSSPNSTTVFHKHVDDAKPGLPFFVFCPVVPMLLDGCALLQLAMVCRTARDSTRNLSMVLQATRREILQVAKYLDLRGVLEVPRLWAHGCDASISRLFQRQSRMAPR